MLAAPGLRDDLVADEQGDLDPDTGEADTGTARLRAGSDVVVAGELASLSAARTQRPPPRAIASPRDSATS